MIKKLIRKFGLNSPQKGQSLVEMALATPILLIMFIGVFEVGWALRGYLVLANANRESARFAIKNATLDYSIKDPATVGYNTVFTHTMSSLANQLPLEFINNPNSTIIMTHFVADTGIPCSDGSIESATNQYDFDASNCDCELGDPSDPDGDGTPWFSLDDLIAHPDDGAYPHYIQTFGVPQDTRLGMGTEAEQSFANIYGGSSGIPLDEGSFARVAAETAVRNNQFNCNVLKTGASGELSIDNVFIAEAFYNQPQLLGLPFVSNSVTDPIPFYTHTAMRIVTSRESDTTDSIGPTCELFPITFPEDMFTDQGYDASNPPSNVPIDAFESRDPGNFGWLTWNPLPSHNNATYIWEELINPRLSLHDYTDPKDDTDHTLDIGGWISSGPGVVASAEDLLQLYVGRTIYVPVHLNTEGTGQNVNYQISHFAEIRIDEICLPNSVCTRGDYSGSQDGKLIRATFNRYVDNLCDAGTTPPNAGNNNPIATNKTVTTPKNTPIVIPVASYATDPDGDTLTVFEVTEESTPFKGTFIITDGGTTVTYTPKSNDSGTYVFRYSIVDGNGGSDTALVTIIVGGSGNVPPVANDDNSYSTPQDTALNINAANGVLTNDSDFDSDPLTAIKVTDPAHGAVTLNTDGSFTYTPTAGYSGSDSFTYKANDGTDDSTTNATVSINVVGNNPPTVTNDSYPIDEDGTLTVNAPGVLNNDSDVESDPLTAIKVSDPGNGTLNFSTDGSFTYTPNPNWYGTDTFAYKANDGNNNSAANATVSIIVNPINDAPVAQDGSFNATENQQLSGQLSFSDIDSVSLTPVAVDTAGLSDAGSLQINADGTFSYTPTGSGTETFTYKVTDSLNAESNIATVTITVSPAAVLTTLIDEDFENSLGGEWSLGSNTSLTSGNSPHAGSQHLEILKKGSGTLNVDMTGVTGAHLTFWYKTYSLDKGTENIEVTVNSNIVLQVYDGDPEEDNTYRYVDVDLSSYTMNSSFEVIFKINGSGTADYFYIDDVIITGYQ